MASFDDTAYGSEAIGPHTDGTYLDQPPGIQVFHCLKPANKGGLTLLVDGFAAAERLRTDKPELFKTLATTPIEHHYLEADRLHARSLAELVIRQFPRVDKIAQIRFNPYDRAPMRTLRIDDIRGDDQKALEECVLFYNAYQHFAQLINQPEGQVKLWMRPGSILFIDNFRVLHGREHFQGERIICGCYLSRDGFLARARPLLSPSLYKNV